MSEILAKITAYQGHLICELLADKSIQDKIVTSIDNPGLRKQTILMPGLHLGISNDALEILREVRRDVRNGGELAWLSSPEGLKSSDFFEWCGRPFAIFDSKTVRGSCWYKPCDAFILIENDFPVEAMGSIDEKVEAERQRLLISAYHRELEDVSFNRRSWR